MTVADLQDTTKDHRLVPLEQLDDVVPVRGPAAVRLQRTDQDCRYSLEPPGPGAWRIAASKDGRSASETVVLPEAPEMEKDLELPEG